MSHPAGCRVLAVMGSGETSPTMVTVHRALVARLPSRSSRAVLIETPYAFQENAADVSARARAYFARSVSLDVTVIPGQAAAGGTGGGARQPGGGLDDLRAAGWVFSGPGSPSYALERWRADGTGQAVRDRVAAGQGITVMASAAAATIGCAALPVYEVYKAGAAPHWLDGLDLLAPLGLRAAVIPHYDNAEGGTHDTRYCYLGERRLSLLEGSLPEGAAVLGVDEHTAAIFDLDAGSVEVAGRGAVTVRRAGHSTVLPHGTALPLAELRSLLRDGHPLTRGHGPAARGPAAGDGTLTGPELTRTPAPAAAGDPPATLTEITRTAQQRFEAAAGASDGPAMAAVILNLETAISDWAADTEEDQGTAQSRAVLRALVTRLGNHAGQPADTLAGLAAAAGPLLALRAELRGQGLYPAADAIRDALSAAGLQIQDTPEGPTWTAPGR